jgi:2-acylglycerol O-acyltransferase 2
MFVFIHKKKLDSIIYSIGTFGNFASSATGFHELFPDIQSTMCTMNYHFYVPFIRELYLASGLMNVSRQSIVNILSGDGRHSHSKAVGF